ncbi:hypothetical protein GH714_022732 [Hevea brasiliensis]|uniref:Uncharacterized protein n=1 Tax=Hevea brasiliensis TaxID=3981 RepID=A0A6A6KIZ3_HEVBR|nr:hypothetical protein GH714_022732 [Hevea brasiliensis]
MSLKISLEVLMNYISDLLDLLMGCVVRVLQSCISSLDPAKGTGSSISKSHSFVSLELRNEDSTAVNHALTSSTLKQFKDLRSLCLKIVSLVINKYDDHDFDCVFWGMFFASVKPLIDGFKLEGSSSEKPSSLFSCFLAMSSSRHLVPLLSRETNLVPDIFSILTVTTASKAIISCVLKFIENLLNLNEELDDEDNSVKKVLFPNLDKLISSLHCLFQDDTANKRKLAKYLGETHTRIFKLLSKYIQDQLQSRKFLDILLPLIATRREDSGVFVECLQIIRDIIPVLGNECTTKILNVISPHLISVELDMRLNICDLLYALAKIDPSVLSVASLLRDLNATSAIELTGLDYDTIISAYEKIDVDLFYTIQEDHALVLLSHFVYDMTSEELILRNSAYRSLLSFVEFCALILDGGVKSRYEIHQEITTGSKCCWTKACVRRIINKFLLKHMGNKMKEGGSVRKEWIELLRDMVLKLPEVENLNSFKVLCSEDAEQDFFNNIIHLQKHRRARAVLRFSNIISKSKMSEDIMNKVFVPLLFSMLFDEQGGKGEHVKTACIEALASISAQMEWKSYYALLIRCFREMKINLDKQKIVVRLICSILDQFHFSQNCFSLENKDSADSIVGSDSTETGSFATFHKCGGNYSAMLPKGSCSVIATEVQACLQKTVLPKMRKLLDCDSDKVNVNINVAALKVLKLLPMDIMDSQLPSIIHRIANNLKSRMESIRDEARFALAACLKELGLEYLQFIVGVLRATLKRGYELHVLGYSLHFILLKFLSNPKCGTLDYCLEDLLSVVENDILGDVAEEKEVEKIASKMKETRKLKSFETLKIISQSITFKTHGLKLLSPVKARLQKHLTPKVKTKLENGINHEDGQGENSSGTEMMPRHRREVNEKTISAGRDNGTKSVCSHLITVFALGLFHNRMKSVKLDKNNEELLSMLDPFVKLLGDCLSSRANGYKPSGFNSQEMQSDYVAIFTRLSSFWKIFTTTFRFSAEEFEVLGLLVEVMNKSFQKHISSILPVSKTILQAAVGVASESPALDLHDEAVPLWKEAYYSLVLLEKILHHFHDLSFEKDFEDIWEAVCELLLHPHPWLRNISSRLVAIYYATVTKASKESHEKALGTFFLMRPHRLFMIAVSLCCQLKTQVIDNAVENLITQNLVFTISAIHSLMGKVESVDPSTFWSTLEQHEQGQFLKAFQLLDARKGKDIFLKVISGVHDQDYGDRCENLQYLLLSNLIKKMGKIALQKEAIQMKIIFNTFGKISLQIEQDKLQKHAFDMLLPLYKVCEGFAGKVVTDELKLLAEEVCKSMRNALGIHNFVQVYSEMRRSIKVKREKRKREEKVMAVVNPMRNAKRKLRIAAKHRAHKRRKIMTMKMGRWMH